MTRNEARRVSSATLQRYEYLDAEAAKAVRRSTEPVQCKKGCSGCCTLPVEVSRAEAVVVAEHLIASQSVDVFRPLLERAVVLGTDDGAPLPIAAYWQKRVPCPFLGSAGQCRIYKWRPAACRFHFVVSNPEHCSDREQTNPVQYLDTKEAVTTIWAVSDAHFEAKVTETKLRLPRAVLDALNDIDE